MEILAGIALHSLSMGDRDKGKENGLTLPSTMLRAGDSPRADNPPFH